MQCNRTLLINHMICIPCNCVGVIWDPGLILIPKILNKPSSNESFLNWSEVLSWFKISSPSSFIGVIISSLDKFNHFLQMHGNAWNHVHTCPKMFQVC